MKTKQLSRNKTIEALHNATGLSYKACREKLKACDWSLERALELDRYIEALDYFSDALEGLKNVLRAFAIASGKALEAFNNSLEEELINA